MIFKSTSKRLRVQSFNADKVKDIRKKGIRAINCDGLEWIITRVIIMPSGRKYGTTQIDIDLIYRENGGYIEIDCVDLSNVFFK